MAFLFAENGMISRFLLHHVRGHYQLRLRRCFAKTPCSSLMFGEPGPMSGESLEVAAACYGSP